MVHPREISRVVAQRFGMNRRNALQHLHALVEEGLISARGRTKARVYELRTLVDEFWRIPLSGAEEHEVWMQKIAPHFGGVKDNVRGICQHGFTEMLNNAIDHSGALDARIEIKKTAAHIDLVVDDPGIGIFEKIRAAQNLPDAREALLELSKGKLTTAPERHSGEGIFFSSRMFDDFLILSGDLSYITSNAESGWLLESGPTVRIRGTRVKMSLSLFSERTAREVFDRFSGEEAGFSKTHVPVALALYGDDKLVSRSQAKRVLSRFDRFKEVMLDFRGVESIGQAFADQIFRVFPLEHPEVLIQHFNAAPEVERVIAWVKGARGIQGPLL